MKFIKEVDTIRVYLNNAYCFIRVLKRIRVIFDRPYLAACVPNVHVTACRGRVRCARAGAPCRRCRVWRPRWRAKRHVLARCARAVTPRVTPSRACATSRPAPTTASPTQPLARWARMAGVSTNYVLIRVKFEISFLL